MAKIPLIAGRVHSFSRTLRINHCRGKKKGEKKKKLDRRDAFKLTNINWKKKKRIFPKKEVTYFSAHVLGTQEHAMNLAHHIAFNIALHNIST